MADVSKIEWTDSTFNPWIGCTKVSPACFNCYAERQESLRLKRVDWGGDRKRTSDAYWRWPDKWQRDASNFRTEHARRQTVFCASLADVFDNEVDSEWRADLFEKIEATPDLIWLLLTKRIGNVVKMSGGKLPPNAAIGGTFANQEEWDRDGHKLHKAKAATGALFSFASLEPMLGPIDLGSNHPDWVIAGGESGGRDARRMMPDWVRGVRDQCAAQRTPFLFKQWGSWGDDGLYASKKKTGRDLDGRTHDGFPAVCERPEQPVLRTVTPPTPVPATTPVPPAATIDANAALAEAARTIAGVAKLLGQLADRLAESSRQSEQARPHPGAPIIAASGRRRSP